VSAPALAEVSYASIDSPLGTLLIAVTERGLLRVAFCEEHQDSMLARIAERVSPRITESRGAIAPVARELEEYFTGRRRAFTASIDRSLIGPFAWRVLCATSEIPYGSVLSYGEVAAEAGSPRGSRAAGNALGSNPIAVVIPCHRVLRSDGAIGGYGGGLHRKRMLLELEGALAPAGS
jgi:methylated-DNA-[protein]-cysteine S-methyltransferase